MKIYGVSFSSRNDGNCTKCLRYCFDKFIQNGCDIETGNIYDNQIEPCNKCEYGCFYDNKCPKDDGISNVIKKIIGSDITVFAVPTYRGHLASSYFMFSERVQGFFRSSPDSFETALLKKINFIIIGNISSGGDMAFHEALYGFEGLPFYPEAILLSSREYGRRSINGDLVEDSCVRGRLDLFVDNILRK